MEFGGLWLFRFSADSEQQRMKQGKYFYSLFEIGSIQVLLFFNKHKHEVKIYYYTEQNEKKWQEFVLNQRCQKINK